jgi:hypothetical protein
MDPSVVRDNQELKRAEGKSAVKCYKDRWWAALHVCDTSVSDLEPRLFLNIQNRNRKYTDRGFESNEKLQYIS